MIWRLFSFSLFVVLAVGFIGGCGPTRREAECLVKTEPIKAYPYVMPPDRKAKFLDSLSTFMPGESRDRVVGILGRPQRVFAICAKGLFQPVRGLGLTYYITVRRPEGLDFGDNYVSLYFDNGGAFEFVTTNIEGLKLRVPQLTGRGNEDFLVPPGGEPRKLLPGERFESCP